MEYDSIIIGAGPGGLSAAVYLGRAQQKTLVIHSGPRRTGHAVHIQNYFGFEDITGRDLLERGIKQAALYGVEFKLASVLAVKKEKDVFEISTATEKFFAKHVIVASGITDVMPIVDNISDFLGETFFTCLDCDGYHMVDKNVCVVGNDEHAVRQALFIKRILKASKVVLCGKQGVDVAPELLDQLEKQKINIIKKEPVHFEGENGKISGVKFEDGAVYDCDIVLSSLGYRRSDSFLAGLDLDRSETGYIKTDGYYESSIKGLYVIGPLNTGPDQVSVAVGEGAIAAMHIIDSL